VAGGAGRAGSEGPDAGGHRGLTRFSFHEKVAWHLFLYFDHRLDVAVHLVRRDDEAGTGLADFVATGGVESDEVDLKARGYHCHSVRSHLVAGNDP